MPLRVRVRSCAAQFIVAGRADNAFPSRTICKRKGGETRKVRRPVR